MQFHILGPSSLLVVVAQPDEKHANRTASVLEWYDRHVAYSTTSGSNKKESFLIEDINQSRLRCKYFRVGYAENS